ncbi:MAG TPA: hypothetical protein VF163_15855, partial [Micromonosporaceae bacterium]
WLPLRILGGVTQSQTLRLMDSWVRETDDPTAAELREYVAIGTETPGAAIDYLYREPAAKDMLQRWWDEAVRPLLPGDVAPAVSEVFRYDVLTQPVYRVADQGLPDGVGLVRIGEEEYAQRAGVAFDYDVPAILTALRTGEQPNLNPARVSVDLYYRLGVETFTTTTNSEEIVHFMGRTKDTLGTTDNTADMSSDGPYNALLRDAGGCA